MAFRQIQETYPLVLASKSPRRKALLSQIALPFRAVPSGIKEEISNRPEETAVRLAEKKAMSVLQAKKGHWTLGADTLVVVDGQILGKPESATQATDMLRRLSGTEHRVVTGFCLINPDGKVAHREAVVTQVRFKELSDREIKAYVSTGEPFGKAGSYAIQGIGAFMVESIRGSYTNVVGLPLCALVKALLRSGALSSFPL